MRTVLLLHCLLAAAAQGQEPIPTPGEHLVGRELGADFTLADWNEVRSYFELLARESPRARLRTLGRTTEGRDLVLAILSSAENLERLDELRGHARTLADPRSKTDAERARAIEEGRALVFVTCAMHATETAAPQMAMQLAYEMATNEGEPWASARREAVVLLVPSLNPDGQDHVVEWYRRTVGTPYEASGLPKLYQYYAGHDNNRDWFMLTQAETLLVTEQLYSVWHPQVYWDVHQQGSSGERLFVPPFRDPLNPNLDPGIIAGIDAIGSRALFDLTREGYRGVSTGVSYDMWWNGGNRNVPVRHNIIGLLTEAASVRLATPIFLPRSELGAPRGLGEYAPSNRFPDPWPGGWWRIADIIDYELAFARSLLGSVARERRTWLANALEASERAIRRGAEEAPRAWLVPSDNRDPGAVRRLVRVLLLSGIEVQRSAAELLADGRTWPAGTLVLRRDQPYGQHLKDLFEVQRYPDGAPPYDVAGWTLPLLMGVRRVELVQPLEGDLQPVTTANDAVAGFAGDPRLGAPQRAQGQLSSHSSDDWAAVFRDLPVQDGREGHAGREGREARTFEFATVGERAGLFVPGEASTLPDEQAIRVAAMPRVGLYSPWQGSMDEGWMRWVFDQNTPVAYVTVRNEMLRAGGLGEFLDVLLVPSVPGPQLDAGRAPGSVPDEFARGLDPEGAVAVEEFVRSGGTLVTLGSSSAWAIELLRLPLVDLTAGDLGDPGDPGAPASNGFSCPGSVLRGIPEPHPLTAGLGESLALFFSGSSAWREMTEEEREAAGIEAPGAVRTLLRYAPTRLLLSGWIQAPETIAGASAWVHARHGAGEVHLFGFRPQYRGWAQGTFQLVFRALLLRAPHVEAEPAEDRDG